VILRPLHGPSNRVGRDAPGGELNRYRDVEDRQPAPLHLHRSNEPPDRPLADDCWKEDYSWGACLAPPAFGGKWRAYVGAAAAQTLLSPPPYAAWLRDRAFQI